MTDLVVKLKELLGAEAEGAWLDFMRFTHQSIPFLLDAGRPSASQIKESEIGQQGFKSWSELIKSIGWNESGWRAWSRAYKIALEYPYLLTIRPSSSLINSTWNRTKPDFPPTLEAWNDMRTEIVKEQEFKQRNSLKTAQNALETAQEEINTLKQGVSTVEGKNSALEAQNKSLSDQVSNLTAEKTLLAQDKEKALKYVSGLKVKIEHHNARSWYKRIHKI